MKKHKLFFGALLLISTSVYLVFVGYVNVVTYKRFGTQFCWYDQIYSSRSGDVEMLEGRIFFPNIFKHYDRKHIGFGSIFYNWLIDRPPHFGVIIVKSDEEMQSDEHWELTYGPHTPEVWAWSYRNGDYWNVWESGALMSGANGLSTTEMEQCRKFRE